VYVKPATLTSSIHFPSDIQCDGAIIRIHCFLSLVTQSISYRTIHRQETTRSDAFKVGNRWHSTGVRPDEWGRSVRTYMNKSLLLASVDWQEEGSRKRFVMLQADTLPRGSPPPSLNSSLHNLTDQWSKYFAAYIRSLLQEVYHYDAFRVPENM
jgi:hypothetical protein